MHPELWDVTFFGPNDAVFDRSTHGTFDSFEEADEYAGFVLAMVSGEWSALVAPALDNDPETR